MTTDEKKRLVNIIFKWSSAVIVTLENIKEVAHKISVIDMGEHDKHHKWFHVSSSRNNAVSYKVCWELRYACEFFVQKIKPCKHILYIIM